ncbi:MAG: hypothetical protein IT462_00940 [Planctomycetes bacterium]|nr:hypothetical protein [Planctomycetota bacterium]
MPAAQNPPSRWAAAALAALFALAGFALVMFATGGDNQRADADSMAYLDGAYFIRAGQGYIGRTFPSSTERAPITHWPPGYAAAIAVVSAITNDEVAAARWLNALLFALVIMPLGHLVWHASKSLGAMALACGLYLFFWPFIKVSVFIWSEPMFLASTCYALLGVWEYLRKGGRRNLALATAAAAMASMTRYAGVAVIAALGACLLMATGSWPRRVGRAALVCGAAALPALLWALRNMAVGGTATNRTLGFDLPDVKLANASRTVLNWFIPGPWNLPQPAQMLLFASLCALLGWGLVRWLRGPAQAGDKPDETRLLVLCCAIFAGVYGAMLVLAVTFVDRSIPMTDRILCPFLLLAICAAGASLGRVLREGKLALRAVVFSIALVFFAANVARGVWQIGQLKARTESNDELLVRRELWDGEKGLR